MDAVHPYPDIPTEIQKEFIGLVSPKGTITIPLEVRKRFNIEPNSKVLLRLSHEALEVKPMPMTLEEIMGSVPPLDHPKTWKELREEKHNEYAERYLSETQE